MRDRILERGLLAPFLGRTHAPIAADLVEEAVDLEVMIVRIAELDRDLAAGAAPPFENGSQRVPAVRASPSSAARRRAGVGAPASARSDASAPRKTDTSSSSSSR